MGVAFSLIPRLAAATDVSARRRLIAGEARLVLLIVVVGSVIIWLVTPPVERVLLAGKYHLSGALILSAIAAGVAKTLNAFSNATVTALAGRRELTLVNVWGWASVALSVAAAAAFARWGLAGVVYGVGLGWLARAVTGLAITFRHLREQPVLAGPAL
jgi:O-antigen/teichoic acid export membrane protein